MVIRFLVSILLTLVVWYAARTILADSAPPLQRIIDLTAVVVVLLLALRFAGVL